MIPSTMHIRKTFSRGSIGSSLPIRLEKRFGCFNETAALKQQDSLRHAATRLFVHALPIPMAAHSQHGRRQKGLATVSDVGTASLSMHSYMRIEGHGIELVSFSLLAPAPATAAGPSTLNPSALVSSHTQRSGGKITVDKSSRAQHFSLAALGWPWSTSSLTAWRLYVPQRCLFSPQLGDL